MTTSLLNVDLTNPDNFVNGVPYDVFKRLRAEAPVYWHPHPEGGGFWVLTKYDDTVTVSMNPAIFSSARGVGIPDQQPGDDPQAMMLTTDPPRHTKLRRLVSAGFTPKMIRRLEKPLRKVTDQILDSVAPRGECDFVTEVAAELPLQVICELIGVPQEDRHLIFRWSNEMIGSADPEYAVTDEVGMRARMEMFAYSDMLAKQREGSHGEDLVSVLMEAEVDGEKLSRAEFNAFFLLLAVAGNETTRNLISSGLLALVQHPDQMARLRQDPSILPTAIEEMLRYVTPVMHFRRTALQDTEVRGQEIRQGEKVVIWYVSANRDEDVFPDPDTFDVGRTPNDHVAFGSGGPHFCLGANLARLEIRIMFEHLLDRFSDIQLAGPVQRLRSNFINGIKHMPVKFQTNRKW